ncbi:MULTISPECIES: hypothetical protein [unclassified Sphingomonas]|uniref:hypothetical protein n=1 Tax=unclassified Sphingomonas TaxID=196159 RepID=UPI000B074D87|nr:MULTISPECIES: hypothetical protein [unclassified Sphingomonas]
MKSGWRAMLLAGSGLLLTAGLAACSNDNVDEAPIENSAFDEEAPPPTPLPEENYEAAPPVMENLSAVAPAEELPPPPPIEPDQQVLDDASATGMTSRSSRGEDKAADDAADAPVDDAMSNQQDQ